MIDGLLVIDKPAGPTSHDVVVRVRRLLGERRAGHTGTLDPAATGVLPLVLGRATRLARFLSGSDKSYEAVVRLGVSTDTADALGAPIGPTFAGPLPSRETIDRALDAFRGTFPQQPPMFSAKKIAGERSYDLARRVDARLKPRAAGHPRAPDVVTVTAHAIDVVTCEGERVTLRVDCSAGFYVRSLAHDLGAALGTGAHLERLRRTRTGELTLDGAIGLAVAERDADRARASVVPLSRMLPQMPSVTLAPGDVRRAMNGCDLPHEKGPYSFFRLVDETGELVGIGEPAATPGLLHPSVILL